MTRFACIIALLASPAMAGDDYPSRMERMGYGEDSLEIRQESADRATVIYHNHFRQLSKSGTFTIQVGNIIVDVQIKIGGSEVGNREIMTVRPREPYIAIPEQVMARDGETVSVLVILPMW